MTVDDAEALNKYCRGVESALARATGRLGVITGASFGVVAGWAAAAIPLAVVEAEIAAVAERQQAQGRPVRIRVDYLDRDVRRRHDDLRERRGPRDGGGGRIRNCPRALGGCGALERGDEDRCVHCGWTRP